MDSTLFSLLNLWPKCLIKLVQFQNLPTNSFVDWRYTLWTQGDSHGWPAPLLLMICVLLFGGFSSHRGTPKLWMVYYDKWLIMDDLGGCPYFEKHQFFLTYETPTKPEVWSWIVKCLIANIFQSPYQPPWPSVASCAQERGFWWKAFSEQEVGWRAAQDSYGHGRVFFVVPCFASHCQPQSWLPTIMNHYQLLLLTNHHAYKIAKNHYPSWWGIVLQSLHYHNWMICWSWFATNI